MKSKIIIAVCGLGVLVLISLLIFNKDVDFNKYTDNKSISQVEKLVNRDLNNELEVTISNDIDSLFDYYICLYIRSALTDYAKESGDNGPFTVSEDFTIYESPTKCSVNITSESGVSMILYMDRDTDLYSLEVLNKE